MSERPESLVDGAYRALVSDNLDEKVRLTNETATLWRSRKLALTGKKRYLSPKRPGRPEKPDLLPPSEVPKRPLNSLRGRKALVHAIAHIELNAIDLALDIIVRFAWQRIPRSFFDGWMMVAEEEAKHFTLLRGRLAQYDMDYGDLPA
ncbi:MAG: DUF455 family protein, partial [Pseudomonadota bacterium]